MSGAMQVTWLREKLRTLVQGVIGQTAFNLEMYSVVIYRSVISAREMRCGVSSGKPIDETFEGTFFDPHARAEYIRHLQMLHHLTEQFVNAMFGSVRQMPYSISSIVRELLAAVKARIRVEYSSYRLTMSSEGKASRLK
ncbi:hypothetical protein CALVIDRAFT_603471 [Calocera viscosa TUFC12733]|uniref:Ras-GAP domain-containing protein n=1 Tax=Calocera viscosa (strain TUFC12733) TaxID=1330018 RepID=A0A167FPT7_CALVF|nr:hypothetical protein CALVIDRAFT_603471 [Calocera viscosa TUFC12733]